MKTLAQNFNSEFPVNKLALTTVFKNKGYRFFSNTGSHKTCNVYKSLVAFASKFGYVISEEIQGDKVKVICSVK